MKEIDSEKLIIYGVTVLGMIIAAPILHRIPRTRGRKILWHLVFIAAVISCLMFIPNDIQDEIFSPGGVVLVGTLWPVYESIVAVCSIDETDDTAWLAFWITSSTLSFSTEWVDSIHEYLPSAGEHWYEFEFFFNLWLLLPMTDGATLLYDVITRPFIAPIARKVKLACEGYIGILMTIINSSYIWFLWYAFTWLPEDARRFVVVLCGVVYPIAASTVAITTKNDPYDDTVWLTYWCSWSLLFITMDYIENFIGHIRGFYSLCVFATVYLFLPMFQGSEVVFRRVLVPLSGQYENMLLHDAYLVKKGMEKTLTSKSRERVHKRAAEIFLKGAGSSATTPTAAATTKKTT